MIEQIHPRDLPDWLQSARVHGDPLVLDVREPWEWQTASVRTDDAEWLALPMRAVPVRLAELDPPAPSPASAITVREACRSASFLNSTVSTMLPT